MCYSEQCNDEKDNVRDNTVLPFTGCGGERWEDLGRNLNVLVGGRKERLVLQITRDSACGHTQMSQPHPEIDEAGMYQGYMDGPLARQGLLRSTG